MVEAGFEPAPPKPPPKRPPVVPDAGAAEDAGVAELVPAAPNNDGAPLVAVAAVPLAVVVEAPLAGVADAGVPAPSSFLKRVEAGVDGFAAPNRLGVAAAAEAAGLSLSPPPRLKPPNEGVAAGCEDAGCVAGVDPPRLNAGGLLAGVLDRPPPPKRLPAGLGVPCELAPAAGAAPKRPGVEGAALLLASLAAAPPLNRLVVGVDAPAGLAPNKLDVVPDAGAAGFEAAFPPKRLPPVVPLDWLLFPPSEKVDAGAGVCPNKFEPGGGPAGVVEGREKVLLGAGVAAGVEEPFVRC